MEFLKFKNLNFEILLYIKDGLETNQLKEIIDKLDVNPIDLVRKQEKIWKENYKSKNLTNKEIINLLNKHSNLIKRPIFISNNKAILAIPPSEIFKILC